MTGNGADGQPLVCYVIEGAVSIFGFGELSWVDPFAQDSLEEAMNGGDFDNGAIDENLIYVRFIPFDTNLNTTIDRGTDGAETKSGGGTPSWAWVLIALGIFGLILCLVYLTLKRRKQQEEFDRVQQEAEFLTGDDAAGEGDEGGAEAENANESYGADEDSAADADAAGSEAGYSNDHANELNDSARSGGGGGGGGSLRNSGTVVQV